MSRLLLISSYVAHGGVGLTATLAPLTAAGVETVALPTVVLSNHPGHPRCAGTVIDTATLGDMAAALDGNGWLSGFDAIFTGYMPSAGHVAISRTIVDKVRTQSAGCLYFCDPVFGDDPGGLYVADDVASAIGGLLVPVADVVSPNRFELTQLAGADVGDIEEGLCAMRNLGRRCIVATSIPAGDGIIANLMLADDKASVCQVRRRPRAPHGTGDLFAGFMLAELLHGAPFESALAVATGGVSHAMDTSPDCDELQVAKIDARHGIVPAEITSWP